MECLEIIDKALNSLRWIGWDNWFKFEAIIISWQWTWINVFLSWNCDLPWPFNVKQLFAKPFTHKIWIDLCVILWIIFILQGNIGRMGPAGMCIRSGCHNRAIENLGWDNEYCSNECVVSHCRYGLYITSIIFIIVF